MRPIAVAPGYSSEPQARPPRLPWTTSRFGWGLALLFVAVFGGVALLTSLGHLASGNERRVAAAWMLGSRDGAALAAVFLGAFATAWLIPLERGGVAVRLALAVAGVVAVDLAVGLSHTLATRGLEAISWHSFLSQNLLFVPSRLPATLAALGTGYAVRYSLSEARMKTEVSATRLRLAEARHRTLMSSRRPDLLLGVLATISELADVDAQAAERLVIRSTKLLRAASRAPMGEPWRLHWEVEFVSIHLETERTRTGRRSSLTSNVPAELLDILVPSGLLYGLVHRLAAPWHATEDGSLAMKLHGYLEDERVRLVLAVASTRPVSDAQHLPLWSEARRLADELPSWSASVVEARLTGCDEGFEVHIGLVASTATTAEFPY